MDLYYSTVLPRRILCVEPWVQLVLLLRNPVDRLLEHYAALRAKGSRRTLEEYVEEELQLLHQVGLFNASSDAFYGSEAEDLAWFDYQTASGTGLIGRSLYVIQLRHWIAALRTAGRDPASSLCLVATERWAASPVTEYRRVLKCLHLAPYRIPSLAPWTPTARPVANATRQQLEDLFRPYNRQLKVLLRQYGIPVS